MTLLIVLLFVVSIGCDVAGQLFFKLGAEALPDIDKVGRRAFVHDLARCTWIHAGLLTYALEMVVWLRILAEVPISIAFPIASLNFLGVALASQMFLKERLAPRQWLGASLVTIGVAFVATTA